MNRYIGVLVLVLGVVMASALFGIDPTVADREYQPTFREWVDVYLHQTVAHYDTEGWDIRVYPDGDKTAPRWSVVLVYDDDVDAETLVYAMRYMDTRERLVAEAVDRWRERGYAISMEDFSFTTFHTKKGILEIP